MGTDYKSAPAIEGQGHGLQIRASDRGKWARITNPRQRSREMARITNPRQLYYIILSHRP
jgi:hypothetical protein